MRGTLHGALSIALCVLFLANMGTVLGADTSPPTITGMKVLVVGETWFTIEWLTDEPTIGGVEFGPTRSYGQFANETGPLATEHSLNVTGLRRDKLYEFRVFARDAANNTGYSTPLSVGTYPWGREDRGWAVVAVFIALPIFVALVLVFFYERSKKQPVR